MAFGLSALVLLGGLACLAVQLGADQQRDLLKAELGTAFAGTTAIGVESQAASDEGFSQLPAAVTTRPTYLGRVGETDEFEARYTVQFFGSYRCVCVRWTTRGATAHDGSGDECTVLRDRPPTE